MTDFAWLLEDGTGKWQLEDGTGNWLLEENPPHAVDGVEIVATHASQVLTTQRRKPKLIPTELVINICAGLITRLGVRLPSFSQKLLPTGLFTEKLRRSMIIPTASLKQKLKEYLQAQIKDIKWQDFNKKYGELGRLVYLKELIKKWKK